LTPLLAGGILIYCAHFGGVPLAARHETERDAAGNPRFSLMCCPARRRFDVGERMLVICLLVGSCILAPGCVRSARSAPGLSVDPVEVVDARISAEERQADADAVEAATAILGETVSHDFGPLRLLSPLAETEKRELAAEIRKRLRDATGTLPAEVETHDRFVATELRPALHGVAVARLEAARLSDAVERDARKAQQSGLALGSEHRWFWLASLIAVGGLLALFAIDRRQEIRRYFNGGRARGLGLGKALVAAFATLCLLTIGLFLASDGLLVALFDRGPTGKAVASLVDQLNADRAAANGQETRLDAARTAITKKQDDARRALEAVLPGETAAAVYADWWRYIDATTRRRGQLRALDSLATRLDEDTQAIAPEGAAANAIESNREAAARWRRNASVICGFIGVALLGLVAGGVAMFIRGVRRRTNQVASTCPLCLAVGKLKEGGGSPADGGRSATAGMVRCENVISDRPFEECDFDFPSMFRAVPKLCFPTLGVPSAGKTHWLAMVYRELMKGNAPDTVEFARIRSRSSELFDRIVEEILAYKQGPGASQVDSLPKPLVFNFIDQDRMGKSNILVNIFDYSGEVLQRMTLEDHQRQRAFTADGYFYFLDPTKDADIQTQPLANFRQDVRIVKKLRAGQQIRCPVALCVPKIDLMTTQSYADPSGGDAVGHFYGELAEIGWDMDVRSITARSKLMRQLRDTIWPGWEIERQIDDLFGGRYMFFPFTPVGLDGLGEDLANRVISPVGILHPLLWLLHMNGYPVLRSHAVA
jgi:hypothetical protein